MNRAVATHPSLVRTVTTTIVITALAAIILQVLIVAARTYLNEDDLMITFVSHEADRLASALKLDQRHARLRVEQLASHLRHDNAGAYAYRIRLADLTEIASLNADLIDKHSPWTSDAKRKEQLQDMWLVRLDPVRRLHVAGGKRITLNDRTVFVEVATLGDPAFASGRILAAEIIDDVWMPMLPLLVLTIGATVIVVRRAMRPLAEISKLAELNELARLNDAAQRMKLPQEVRSFVSAIGRLVERIQDLLDAQRAFVARAAHELRTPLAAMTLEVERPEGADRLRLCRDIAALREMVDQLLLLSRLEMKEVAKAEALDLEFLAEEVIEQMAPIARIEGHEVALHPMQPTTVTGDALTIQHALRNLLRNACEHTSQGAGIIVSVGPGALLSVSDDGKGWGSFDIMQPIAPFNRGNAVSSGTGLGLSIVKQAAEALGGSVALGVSDAGGAKVVVDWRQSTVEST